LGQLKKTQLKSPADLAQRYRLAVGPEPPGGIPVKSLWTSFSSMAPGRR